MQIFLLKVVRKFDSWVAEKCTGKAGHAGSGKGRKGRRGRNWALTVPFKIITVLPHFFLIEVNKWNHGTQELCRGLKLRRYLVKAWRTQGHSGTAGILRSILGLSRNAMISAAISLWDHVVTCFVIKIVEITTSH